MRRPVDGEVHVHYGQIYVESDPDAYGPALDEAFAGQSAGLCGAAVPGALWLHTGLHTGSVGFTVEVHDQAPPLDETWEDVVEVSFRPVSDSSTLMEWAGEASWDLGLEQTDYRVRYCARGMDAGHRMDTRLDRPQADRYLLQFWPAPPAPDRVLKQTSAIAAYWHAYAREQPPAPTPAERAEAERRARLARERAEEERRLAYDRWYWGGELPSRALREAGGNVHGLLPFDPALVHAIDAAGPAVQRRVAVLAARRACEAAGLAGLDWVAGALAALAEDRPLPPPFDDGDRMWQVLNSDPRVPDRTVCAAVPPERPPFRPPTPAGTTLEPAAGSSDLVGSGAAGSWDLVGSGAAGLSDPVGPGAADSSDPVGPGAADSSNLVGSGAAGPLDLVGRDAAGPPDLVGPAADGPPELVGPAADGPKDPAAAGPSHVVGPAAACLPSTGPLTDCAPGGTARLAVGGGPRPPLRLSQPHMALPAVLAAAVADPLRAALDAVFAAVVTYGDDYPALLEETAAALSPAESPGGTS
ncbi:hypothetical protein AB0K80_32270 [Streptomyces sp. NPDC052682]|uniref:hypothetical protein n=1 Tax=Streptomyces sp. NPDC052682 TaxID=3154954 RepID=UPI003444D2C3